MRSRKRGTEGEWGAEHARNMLERAIRDGSLRDIAMFHPDGRAIDEVDATAWRNVDWESGWIEVEGSWSGSPPA